MTNIEWLQHNNGMLEPCLLERWGVNHGVPQLCERLECDNCDFVSDFGSDFSCQVRRKAWLRQEYKSRLQRGDVVLTDKGEIRVVICVKDGDIKVSDNSHTSLDYTSNIQESEIQRVLANIFE